MFFVILVTKYRYDCSLILANCQNLFYHSKNHDGLAPVHSNPGYAYKALNPPTSYIYFLR
ncbi:hypothetical protein C3432_09730 [Citrobacter amalonaticus]|uniref:Uncharacterized protein n=1 Tax=Citrobacter amalonaticus TaxID=35703 RepID=A0A2S4RZV1_CITAM|nr:hypothetical protein C3432_09730 [Citrobacter amalonaticus]POT76292.1 hypothetical protein C3436_02095 [Citrobacter amalonaticus]POU66710.1 hypothetical protein C3430_07930 [Citrobacter amalonaticus]POV05527.1 hypothetical protein C3424_09400 [Citrobacter amalonaticus]